MRGSLKGAGDLDGANVCLYETVNDGSSTKRELTQIGKTKSDGIFAVQVPAGPFQASSTWFIGSTTA